MNDALEDLPRSRYDVLVGPKLECELLSSQIERFEELLEFETSEKSDDDEQDSLSYSSITPELGLWLLRPLSNKEFDIGS